MQCKKYKSLSEMVLGFSKETCGECENFIDRNGNMSCKLIDDTVDIKSESKEQQLLKMEKLFLERVEHLEKELNDFEHDFHFLLEKLVNDAISDNALNGKDSTTLMRKRDEYVINHKELENCIDLIRHIHINLI